MGDGVILTDAKGGVIVVNRAARELLGLAADDPRPDFERLSASLGLSPFELVRGWEYGGAKTMREELRLHERDLELVVTPVAGAARELKGLVLVLRDVSEQKLLTQRKDEFVGIISHELRTPLTSIAGALDLVLNRLAGDITEKQTRFLGMARESTERLNALVDDLLDLAKFEQGGMRMDFQLMHLDELVKVAVERYGPSFAERKVEVSLEVDRGRREAAGRPQPAQPGDQQPAHQRGEVHPPGRHGEGDGGALGRGAGERGALGVELRRGDRGGRSGADLRSLRAGALRQDPRAAGHGPGPVDLPHHRREPRRAHLGRARRPTAPASWRCSPRSRPSRRPRRKSRSSAPRGTVLVVEDEPQLAWLLKARLLCAGFKVVRGRRAARRRWRWRARCGPT